MAPAHIKVRKMPRFQAFQVIRFQKYSNFPTPDFRGWLTRNQLTKKISWVFFLLIVTNEDVPLHFVDEEHEEEDSSPVSQTESGEFDQEQSSSRTRRRSSGEYDEGLFIFPQNNGYFKILADNKTSDNRQKIMEDIFSHKVTVIGLFGKEKSSDSNKAIEIFDNLAQRDLFSSMERSNDKVFVTNYITFFNPFNQ